MTKMELGMGMGMGWLMANARRHTQEDTGRASPRGAKWSPAITTKASPNAWTSFEWLGRLKNDARFAGHLHVGRILFDSPLSIVSLFLLLLLLPLSPLFLSLSLPPHSLGEESSQTEDVSVCE